MVTRIDENGQTLKRNMFAHLKKLPPYSGAQCQISNFELKPGACFLHFAASPLQFPEFGIHS